MMYGNAAIGNIASSESASSRYTPTAQALHWLVAAMMFAVLPLGWIAVALPEQNAWSQTFFTLHKSFGLTILALTAVRLAWRARNPAPALPPRMARWEQVSATASHWLLYAVLVGMPLSGYLLSSAGGHAITYFGIFSVPTLPKSKAWEDAAMSLHVATGQWLVYALILLHLAATAFHVVAHRDGIIDRMLPPQDGLLDPPRK